MASSLGNEAPPGWGGEPALGRACWYSFKAEGAPWSGLKRSWVFLTPSVDLEIFL